MPEKINEYDLSYEGLFIYILENYDLDEFIFDLHEYAENNIASSSEDDPDEDLEYEIDEDGFYQLT
jgi:hypothetical protein